MSLFYSKSYNCGIFIPLPIFHMIANIPMIQITGKIKESSISSYGCCQRAQKCGIDDVLYQEPLDSGK